ncbi:MAG: class I SAM-dependent methyltransferase [Desulfobacterales bacterium]|nr:class I SAM-dependent methyltransferase [Desulfobacterales bacterium]
MESNIKYHLCELDIASNKNDSRYCMPDICENEKNILDIGCGIGQFFISQKLTNKFNVGIDINLEALSYGIKRYKYINYVNADGVLLPFKSHSFDVVISRVSLPYTNIPKVISEIARVIKPNGRIWLSFHPLPMILKQFKFSIKDIIFRLYVILNGLYMHCFGRLIPFLYKNKYESFQTAYAINRILKANSFSRIEISKGKHFVVKAIYEASS